MKLKSKFFSIFIIFILCTLLPIILYFNYQSEKASITLEKENLTKITKNFSTFINDDINNKINLAFTMISSPIVKQHILRSNKEFSKLTTENRKHKINLLNNKWKKTENINSAFVQNYLSNDLSNFLKDQQKIVSNLYGEIFITNKYGSLISSTGKLTTLAHRHKYWWKESYNQGKGKIFIDDRGYDKSVKGYVLGIVLPIFDKNEFIGIIKVNLNIEGIFKKLITKLSSNHNATLEIVRSEGLVVYKKGTIPLSETIKNEDILIINKTNNGNFQNNKELVSFSKIKFIHENMDLLFGGKKKSIAHSNGNSFESWHILLKIKTENLVSSTLLNNNNKSLALVFFFLITFLLIFIFFISKYILSPLQVLTKSAEKIAVGNFNTQISIDSNDEIGNLTKIFNNMIFSLNSTMISKTSLLKELKEKDEYERVINDNNLVSKTDIKGNITYVNDEFCRFHGYQKEELLGKNHSVLHHKDVKKEVFKKLWKTILSGNIWKGITKNFTKDKKTIYLHTTIFPIFDEYNNIKEFIAMRFDITQEMTLRLQLEEQYKNLSIMSTRLQTSQKIGNIGSYEFNIKTNEVFWSEEHFRIVNEKINSFKPTYKQYLEFIHPDDKSFVEEKLNHTILSGENTLFNYRLQLKDNTIKYVESTATITKYDLDEKPLIVSGNIIDKTEKVIQKLALKEKERLLVQQSKMATMGEMIGSIAHQWKQPISLISMSSGVLRMSREEKDLISTKQIDDSLDYIDNAVINLTQTIDDFRNFFNPNKERTLFKIRDAFNETFKLTLSQFKGNNIEIIKSIDDNALFGSQNELQQTLINLLKNAKEALIKKESQEKRLLFIESYKENEKIVIKIKDNANGIPINIIDKIFDSYFTTKEKEGGSGIGLYMCKQIVEGSMKGSITVLNVDYTYEDKTYQGVEFIIKIPLDLKDKNR